jgi:histone acetyltransferase HTATIP
LVLNQPDEDEYAKRMAVMVRNIDHIHIGKFDVEAWYYSPFPIAEDSFNRRLYICEFCLSFFGHESELRRHTVRAF